MVETTTSTTEWRASERGSTVDDADLPSRYAYDPRQADERCGSCAEPFVLYEEDVLLEPTCVVFVCAGHFVTGGDCPGSTIRVYEDGYVSRIGFGSE